MPTISSGQRVAPACWSVDSSSALEPAMLALSSHKQRMLCALSCWSCRLGRSRSDRAFAMWLHPYIRRWLLDGCSAPSTTAEMSAPAVQPSKRTSPCRCLWRPALLWMDKRLQHMILCGTKDQPHCMAAAEPGEQLQRGCIPAFGAWMEGPLQTCRHVRIGACQASTS